MAKQETAVRQRPQTKGKAPGHYEVTMHNDDVTTMDFVVRVLREVFFKSEDDARELMLRAHTKGQAVVGVYSLDIAQSKIDKVKKMARAQGFPLKLTYKAV